jgi:hypothetical protein
LLEALGVLRREIGAQLNDNAALRRVDDERIRLVEVCGQRLREGGRRTDKGDNNG